MFLQEDSLDWDVKSAAVFASGARAQGYQAIVRNDTNEVLGIHKDRYEHVSNATLREFAQIVAEEAGATIRGSWSIKNGAVVGMQLADGTYVLPGDPSEYKDYFVLGNSHNGSLPFVLHPTQVRIICQNTFYAAMRGNRSLGYTFKHTASINDKIKEAQLAIRAAYADRADFLEWAEALNSQAADQEAFVNALILDTKSEAEAAIQAVEDARQVLRDVIQRPTNDVIRESAWGLLNAGVEYLDHFEERRNTKTAAQARALRTIGFTGEKTNRLRSAMQAALR